MHSATRSAKTSWKLRRLPFFLIALGQGALLAPPAHATLIIEDPNALGFPKDPAFSASLAILLDETLPVNPGDQSFTITVDGVQISFETTSSNGLLACFGFEGAPPCLLQTFHEPIVITFDPPIAAFGVVGVDAECGYAVTIVGNLGTESHNTGFVGPIFIGAADIGDISFATLDETCAHANWTSMRIVPGEVTEGQSDVGVDKTGPSRRGAAVEASYEIDIANNGPENAENVRVVDFLPPGTTFTGASAGGTLDPSTPIVTWSLGELAAPGGGTPSSALLTLSLTTPPFDAFSCEDTLLNIGVATTTTPETATRNNFDWATTVFDKSSRVSEPELCANGSDDDCDGRTDCSDSECFEPCTPPIETAPAPEPDSGAAGTETVNDCTNLEGIVVPPCCCDPVAGLFLNCEDQGVECLAFDPNFKESDPPTNAFGYGYATAGQTITYTVHYENIGGADAHDVSVVDVLHPDLDDTTLVVRDGGVYDPLTRAILWGDPVVPPHTPRSVRFSVNVRADLAPHSRVRNVATIIFPDAAPPSRIDTNFVEHTIIDPNFPVVTDLTVVDCVETAPGSNEWTVTLTNSGFGFAYNVTATIVNPPSSVQVSDATAVFAHPDDVDPTVLATVMPLSTSISTDTVSFVTATPMSPCGALTWQICYSTGQGERVCTNVQAAADGDADAVADDEDNCPDVFNPEQIDSDGDQAGDACDLCPSDPDRTIPETEICGDGIDQDCDGQDLDCSTLVVVIDIKPGSFPNSINPRSEGVIPVAILTTASFDATAVDPRSVQFGPTGAREAHEKGHVEDADGDGDLDLVLHFGTQDTGIVCRTTAASLTGQTFAGQAIEGSDSIRTVGCQ
jgi:uncharacterized repeat protein (TIGR01451 family)